MIPVRCVKAVFATLEWMALIFVYKWAGHARGLGHEGNEKQSVKHAVRHVLCSVALENVSSSRGRVVKAMD